MRPSVATLAKPAFPNETTVEDLNWHHVAITREGTIAKLYIDGSERVFTAVSQFIPTISPNGFITGQDQDELGSGFGEMEEDWAGDIDNLRVYRRALSAPEIQLLSQTDIRP